MDRTLGRQNQLVERRKEKKFKEERARLFTRYRKELDLFFNDKVMSWHLKDKHNTLFLTQVQIERCRDIAALQNLIFNRLQAIEKFKDHPVP